MRESYISTEGYEDAINWSGMPREEAEKIISDFKAKYPNGALLRTHMEDGGSEMVPFVPEHKNVI